ncbi:hypothetical protein Asppvi_000697 [Aspergillus pseudoviridinutans]|uniref:Uncharacterized protein n=1 Tax=Aspergillus pseudoviridinutans TaxID=1517512 RepID=A0A9P3B6N9_9EURO|nr:uncharacterized protein Asppvi_000697 [Aspergillus pseudoviridinutans]GIJ82191.1 hypothetical protein Asppvi_000697 [Aspergillus pseudoviridinutans]
MLGKVVLEETYEHAGLAEESKETPICMSLLGTVSVSAMCAKSMSPGERLQLSNGHGIAYTVIFLTLSGIQNIADKTEAAKVATLTNNWIAEQIKEHQDRVGSFFLDVNS